MKDTFCIKQTLALILVRAISFYMVKVHVQTPKNGKCQPVVPKTLIQDVIRENHDLVFVEHPGIQRTYGLISLNYWWPGMCKSTENYV